METWLIYALLATLFAGVTAVLAKFGLKNINADLGVAIRTTVVLIVVLLNVFAWKGIKDVQQLTGKAVLFLVLSGLTTAFSWIFYYRAVKLGDVSVVASIDKGSIVLTILLSFLFLKEPMTPKLLVGAGLILAGMIVLVWK